MCVGLGQKRGRLSLLAAAVVLCSSRVGAQSDYYVSATGSDTRAGTSPSLAWRTIARVNQQTLRPGDTVLFEAGSAFPGTIVLSGNEGGTPLEPITFASYGTGSGEIRANAGTGFDLNDVSGIRIANLIVTGSGLSTNNGYGISFFTDLPGDVKLPWIRITRCRVTGFRLGGISIVANRRRTGFENVRVTYCRLDHNGNNGMSVSGFFDPNWGQTQNDYPHRSIYVGYNIFESNWGDPQQTTKNTGSGCVISQAADVLIEFNEAFDNGRGNTFSGGGPVGIWMWDVLDGVIQHCESHHNRSGTHDGGGFDLDGGCVDSSMQYNYSHDNDGPGFLVGQFANGGRPMRDVTVRYNVSQRDGGRAAAGALALWNNDLDDPIDGALFHNNTVFIETKPVGIPRAIKVFGNGDVVNSGFFNNILYSRGPSVWLSDCVLDPPPLWVGNLYFAENGPFQIRERGVTYTSLEDWRAGTGHEFLGRPTGFQANPLLEAPGTGGTISDPDELTSLTAYRLLPSSPFKDLGFPLANFVSIGSVDYFGLPVLQGVGLSIGAHEGQ